MKYIPVCISLFFVKIMNYVKPYLLKVNHFVKSISRVFSYSQIEIMKSDNKAVNNKNDTYMLIPGYMDHDPKKYAFRKY